MAPEPRGEDRAGDRAAGRGRNSQASVSQQVLRALASLEDIAARRDFFLRCDLFVYRLAAAASVGMAAVCLARREWLGALVLLSVGGVFAALVRFRVFLNRLERALCRRIEG